MAIAKVFMSGRSQAVRLPKEFRVTAKELSIKQVGNSLVLTPINPEWSDFFAILQEFDADVDIERNQPEGQQIRESLEGE